MHALTLARSSIPTRASAALTAYGSASLAARIEGASPHALVQMLYDRLLQHIREARQAGLAGNTAGRLKATAHAITIIDGLDATLDDRRGGDVAASLHQVYRLLSDRMLAGTATALGEAETAIRAIADAWRSIRQDMARS